MSNDMNDDNLIGAWRLLSSIQSRNGVETASFGEKPHGQLQYTADGRMGAFLMHPDWQSSGENATKQFDLFFSYGGGWRIEGDQVHHDIEFCSIPARIGTCFTRTLKWVDDDHIHLLTKPETSRSGTVFITRLLWQRCG